MTPDQLARANNEHSHQRALFAWANMAARFGFVAAWDNDCYSKFGYAALKYGTEAIEHGEPKMGGPGPAAIPTLERMFAIPNGGARDKITAGKLKAEGVKPGVPDIMLPVPVMNDAASGYPDRTRYCGLFVEMKRPGAQGQRAGSTSDVQDSWISYLRSVGYAVAVCFEWREAAKQIQLYVEAAGGSDGKAKRADA